MPWRVDCWNCDEGDTEDCSCGEDCCVCLYPDPRQCSVCRGRGFLVVSELTDDNCETAVQIPVDTSDELHQILGDALSSAKPTS